MSDIAIRVQDLSKQYRIGGRGAQYNTLRERIVQAATSPLRLLRYGPNGASRPETIWALKDVSFEVKRGEVIGIIGRNGAGKSTLLKILSRITKPTVGRAEVYGRVGSLLEVGTGFHPELTGRENIYLNGAILGMRKVEIERKFDEIVAFAEIEKFLDTPVKHYSSGMYVRLAFAVAAHLEPEILLVDEVLAVGDAGFQKKCLGKMGEVAQQGRTVLFVSHNMPAVQRLCPSCIWLSEGKVRLNGAADMIVLQYMGSTSDVVAQKRLPADPARPMRLRRVHVLGQTPEGDGLLEFSEPINIVVEYDVNRSVSSAHVACFVYNNEGICVLGTGDADVDYSRLGSRQEGHYKACVRIPPRMLGEGTYTITVTMGVPYVAVYDRHEAIVQFELIDHTSNRRELQHRRRPGVLGLELPWSIEKVE